MTSIPRIIHGGLLVMLMFGSISSVSAQKGSSVPSGEEYNVYNAVLDDKFEDGELAFKNSAKILVLRDETVPEHALGRPEDDWQFTKKILSGLNDATLSDFERANKQRQGVRYLEAVRRHDRARKTQNVEIGEYTHDIQER